MRTGVRVQRDLRRPRRRGPRDGALDGLAAPSRTAIPSARTPTSRPLGASGPPRRTTFTYRSADTDMLGWVCERAAGSRMADLVSDPALACRWAPSTTPRSPATRSARAIHDGGISAIARDLARFGQLLLDDGRVDGREVVPAAWLDDALEPPGGRPRGVRGARTTRRCCPAAGTATSSGSCRPATATALVCLGIHGQMVYVNRDTRTRRRQALVLADPQAHRAHLIDTLRAFGSAGIHLAAATARP